MIVMKQQIIINTLRAYFTHNIQPLASISLILNRLKFYNS